jgi:hypothetical protein
MNNKLKELMLEAGYAAPELAVRAQKLAELLVRECATLADDFGVHLAGYRDTEGRDLCYAIRDMTKQHFGVKYASKS